MTLRDRIPVEPLEEERLARIERAVVAGLPARPARSVGWRLIAPLAVATVVAAAALVVWRSRGGEEQARVDDPVVVTAAEDGARVDLGDAVITTGAGASFTVTRPGGGVAVHLARGRIELDVAPRKDRPPLIVYADDVEVIVVGTRFTVEWDDEVTVTVAEGLVRVERGGDSKMVAAGETWSQPARVAVAVAGPVAEPDVELRDRKASAPPEPEPEPEPEPVKEPKKRKDRPVKVPVVVDPLDDLRSAIRGGKVDAPAANYQELVKKSGEEGARGLYGLAYDEQNDDKQKRLLDSYVRRFPRGDNLDDVLWLRVKSLCRKNFDAACRTAAHTFISKAPSDDERIRIAVRVTNTN